MLSEEVKQWLVPLPSCTANEFLYMHTPLHPRNRVAWGITHCEAHSYPWPALSLSPYPGPVSDGSVHSPLVASYTGCLWCWSWRDKRQTWFVRLHGLQVVPVCASLFLLPTSWSAFLLTCQACQPQIQWPSMCFSWKPWFCITYKESYDLTWLRIRHLCISLS